MKTTEELIEILKQQWQLCADGYRSIQWLSDEMYQKFVDDYPDELPPIFQGKDQIRAYHEYHDLINKYQIENNISAIQWRTAIFGDVAINYPEPNSQLTTLPSDLELMAEHRQQIVAAWLKEVERLRLSIYHYCEEAKDHVPVSVDDFLMDADHCVWSLPSVHQVFFIPHSSCEVSIKVGWGCPNKAMYKDAVNTRSKTYYALGNDDLFVIFL